ncbi:hypothetical protein [Virgibacillus doumboii]|uniref:hypothetical protein n=1 Tax=Virgibacillus doumboii TaxID=2697503 RepID=UPI0013DEE5E7|nr:hypothetical protein [Virgibacillus doumboii]
MEVIFVILAIIGGLAGFIKDKSDNNSGKPKRTFNTPKPSPTPSGGRNTTAHPVTDYAGETVLNTASIEEQQEEQRNRLAERMQTPTHKAIPGGEHDALIGNTIKEPEKDLSAEQKRLRRRIKTNLNQKGLVNGIIMSEVLGPPRANKPYRSIVSQRRK